MSNQDKPPFEYKPVKFPPPSSSSSSSSTSSHRHSTKRPAPPPNNPSYNNKKLRRIITTKPDCKLLAQERQTANERFAEFCLEIHKKNNNTLMTVDEDDPVLTIERWDLYDKLYEEFERMCNRMGSLLLELKGLMSRWIFTQKLVESADKRLDPVFSVCEKESTVADAGAIHELKKCGLSSYETQEIVKMLKEESLKYATALNEKRAKLPKGDSAVIMKKIDSKVQLSFERRMVFLSESYYQKLHDAYRRHLLSVSPTEKQEHKDTIERKDKETEENEHAETEKKVQGEKEDKEPAEKANKEVTEEQHLQLFHNRLFCMLARYEMLGGRGMHASVPKPAFELLHRVLEVNQESFASPFNRTLSSYCSAFIDVDQFFESRGSFFDFILSDEWRKDGGSFEANPPFVEEIMIAMAQQIMKLMEEVKDVPVSFIIFLPGWDDTPAYDLLQKSTFTRRFISMEKGTHGYQAGFQHLPGSPENVAYCKSFVFIVQNPAACKKWPIPEDFDSKLRATMKQ